MLKTSLRCRFFTSYIHQPRSINHQKKCFLKKDKKISFQDKNIYFAEGDQVVVAIAYHYKKNEFSKYLKMYSDNVKLYTSKDDSYGLALCKK